MFGKIIQRTLQVQTYIFKIIKAKFITNNLK